MKKLFTLFVIAASFVIVAPTAQVMASDNSIVSTNAEYTPQRRRSVQKRRRQIRRRIRRQIRRSRVRVVNRSRYVRRGRNLYRETYQYRYLPNGRVQIRLIRRVFVRRYYYGRRPS